MIFDTQQQKIIIDASRLLDEKEVNNMPYESTNTLPEGIKNVLPQHAQEIYKEAFNNAYEEYKDSDQRRDGADREETAHKVAWSAVKKAGYHKDGSGKWRKKSS